MNIIEKINSIIKNTPKKKWIALLLWMFGGLISTHNLYLGRYKKGMMVITFIFIYSMVAFISSITYTTLLISGIEVPSFYVVVPNISLVWGISLKSFILTYYTSRSVASLVFLIILLGIVINLLIELYEIITNKVVDDQGRNVFTDTGVNEEVLKSKAVAVNFCVMGGLSCVHNFYLGRNKRAIFLVITVFILSLLSGCRFFNENLYSDTMSLGYAQRIFLDWNWGMKIYGILSVIVAINWVVEFIGILLGKIKNEQGDLVFKKKEESIKQ